MFIFAFYGRFYRPLLPDDSIPQVQGYTRNSGAYRIKQRYPCFPVCNIAKKLPANEDVSRQFFAWLMRFGKRVQILSPDTVKKQFTDYLDEVRARYKDDLPDKPNDKPADK